MKVYCLQDFKDEYQKLIRKEAYKSLTQEIIDYFFIDCTLLKLKTGVRLNGSSENIYIKKRLGGSGGFRIYFYLLIKSEIVYLLYVHPKAGPRGGSNITDESKAKLYKTICSSITSGKDFIEVKLLKSGDDIEFTNDKTLFSE